MKKQILIALFFLCSATQLLHSRVKTTAAQRAIRAKQALKEKRSRTQKQGKTQEKTTSFSHANLRKHLETGTGETFVNATETLITLVQDTPEAVKKSTISNHYIAIYNRIIFDNRNSLTKEKEFEAAIKAYDAALENKTTEFQKGSTFSSANISSMKKARARAKENIAAEPEESAKELKKAIVDPETMVKTCLRVTQILKHENLRKQYTRDEMWSVLKALGSKLFPFVGKGFKVTRKQKNVIVKFFKQAQKFTIMQDDETYLLFGDKKGFYKAGLVNNWPKYIQDRLKKSLELKTTDEEDEARAVKITSLKEIEKNITRKETLEEACKALTDIIKTKEKREQYSRNAVWKVVKKLAGKLFPLIGDGMDLTQDQITAVQNLFAACKGATVSGNNILFGDGKGFVKSGRVIKRPRDIKRWVKKADKLK